MSEVKIPVITREKAKAIEHFRKVFRFCNEAIIGVYRNDMLYTGPISTALRSIPFDTLLAALVNGWTVETVEETRRTRVDKLIRDFYGYPLPERILDDIERIYNPEVNA